MILVTHAYSRVNLGDALLVDETVALLRRLFPAEGEIVVAALDAASFAHHVQTLQVPGTAGCQRLSQLVPVGLGMCSAVLGKFPYARFDALAHKITLIVAVGGAYWRTGNPVATAKMMAAHFPQLLWAAQQNIPTIYLPQSVGPLYGVAGQLIKNKLGNIDVVCVRDDLSHYELSSLTNIHRFPDLAILKLARHFAGCQSASPQGKIFLSARPIHQKHLRHAYGQQLQRLRHALPQAEVITQSFGRNNNDENFYRQLGWETPCRTLDDLAAANEKGVMISVRLHGALQAMTQGIPAIHLSYERKGYGAYQDLDLMPWVHPVADFDVARVATQALETLKDPQPFWQRVEARMPQIREKEQALLQLIAQTASGAAGVVKNS